jgi:hypothetical protein
MYNWEVKIVDVTKLEQTLEQVPPPWEVFAILASGANFLVVVRRPK